MGERKLINEIIHDMLNKQYPAGTRLTDIANRCGLSERFMYQIRKGEVKDPRGSHCQRIYEQLSGKELDLFSA